MCLQQQQHQRTAAEQRQTNFVVHIHNNNLIQIADIWANKQKQKLKKKVIYFYK